MSMRVVAPATAKGRAPRVVGRVEQVPYDALVGSERWRGACSVSHGTPLHITGVPQLERLSREWTDDWIIEKVGDHLVDLDYSENGVFPGGAEAYDGEKRRMLELPIEEVLRRIHAGGTAEAPESRLYVYGANPRPFETLLADYQPPHALIGEADQMHTQFWIGGAGATTPAHFDVADNLLGQVRGTKKVLLWDPDQYPLLYVNPTGARYERNSNLGSLDTVDYASFPEFAKAKAFSCELSAGEMLFIPLGWFHYVRSANLTISINHFWHAPEMRSFLDAGYHFLRGEVRPELLALMVHLMSERLATGGTQS